ncbi:RNA polymerase sigma factor SigJ [Actinomadura roseirufa]|uniref:RNA polymerase sigma factor SigJ n=1 Tax=Actinomadura roseirufa TaxID=2094049 RepID=UPI001040F14C|nr:RNA polymerase sigma factor SigJ [Actinomadura roseirufa]
MSGSTSITQSFEEHRDLLFSVTYRMLGSVSDTEDVLQDLWLRLNRVDSEPIGNHRAYLLQAATRLAIDRMRRIEARRETYVGPWLPEPLLTQPDATQSAEVAESVSMAMLVVLETLSPLERVVFVLREVFAFGYPEVADATGRSEAAVRQLNRRARGHVRDGRPRFRPDRNVHREVTDRFIRACRGGALDELLELLAPDVTLVIDANGTAETPRVPLHGMDEVAAYLAEITRGLPDGLRYRGAELNGLPGTVLVKDGAVYAAVTLDLEPATDRVAAVRVFRNITKLSGIQPEPDAQTATAPDQQPASDTH